MPTTNKGAITWKGDSGKGRSKYARSSISDVTDDTAMQVLGTALEAHTLCNKSSAGWITKTTGNDNPPGASADTGKKGTIYFRESVTQHVRSLTIAAPIAADIENVGTGDQYKAASVATITALLATATGLTLTPLYGTIEDDA